MGYFPTKVDIFMGSTILCHQYVTAPQGAEEATSQMNEFQMAGFNGCVGSSDATYHLRKIHIV
jgi:hypothetical protein